MLSERLQILVSPDQRRRLEAEAARRGMSVGLVVREAIDASFDVVDRDERLRAVSEIAAMRGRFLEPEALERLVDEERREGMPTPAR